MKKTGKLRTFANNAYAVKNVWSISKSRVIHTALDTIVGYVEWIFMSIFFTRYVIHVIETGVPFEKILGFIGLCFIGFSLIAMYNSYMSSVIVPFTDNKIYRVLYKKLYAKARALILDCMVHIMHIFGISKHVKIFIKKMSISITMEKLLVIFP